ncbi:pyridoxamine 5'-phosphate oxidase family protein [Salinicoccus halitifaciens]|uniref:General stress protein 26 n=1 Tax=Salinicoccus halitifaciens TaxID=1073415 RepID=A0ABV2E7T8_9STAP|nr:pyridoxamine 5'-phosphate oxidase family protein [Salinicoccus halitifaciens]
MEREMVKKEVERILDAPRVGIMSTAYGNKPHSRYVTFYNDGRNLYTEVTAESVDTDEIRDNNLSYIILGYDEEADSSYVEMLARTEVVMDQPTVDWLWDQQEHHDIEELESQVMVVLKFIPKEIKLMNANDEIDVPEVLDFAG